MRRSSGFPIAAYLGALVALALASAFIAVLAIVIWLPPRPPDVMRADEVADHFGAGYDYMLVEQRPLPGDAMAWRVQADAPEKEEGGNHVGPTRVALARQLSLHPEQVTVSAANVVRNDVFVFRVQDMDELRREALEGLAEALREAQTDRAEADEAMRIAGEAMREAESIMREVGAADPDARELAREAREALREAQREQQRAREVEHRLRVESSVTVITSTEGAADSEASEEAEAPAAPEPRVQIFNRRFTAPDAPAPQAPLSANDAMAPSPPAPPMFAPAPAGAVLISGFEIGAQLPDGRWLVMRQGRNWAEIGWIMRAASIIGGTLLLLSLLAVLFARRLTRPIRSFSDAVQAVGVDPQSEPVHEEGPRELRGAARAVNTMQARLRALIADRTKTLAAVAHDMRTPLMRLRLAAENVTPEQRERMAKEIAEVEALVASFIAFARDDPAEEARVRLDLSSLLQSIADDQVEAGRKVSFEGEERLVVTGQSLGLKRLFANLIENALKYGGCARVTLRRDGGSVVIDVEDDGPGISVEQRDSVFEPFVRLNGDENKTGAGLGLPAARSIARAHGGDVVIADAESGACVRVTLPA